MGAVYHLRHRCRIGFASFVDTSRFSRPRFIVLAVPFMYPVPRQETSDEMVKARPAGARSAPHQPTIPPAMGLKRLQSLLGQIPTIRSSARGAAEPKVWEKNVKIVLAEFYGEDSLTFKEFARIWFTQG